MKRATSIYLSEKDLKKIEILKNAYECDNTSELIRILIKNECEQIHKYQELNIGK